jgi:hypothetical protein
MRYEAVILSDTLREEIPEKIKVDPNNTFVVKEAEVIITEFDRNVTPFIPRACEKGFTVGLKLRGERRHFEDRDGSHFVSVEPDQMGDFVYLSEDASMKDFMISLENLIRSYSNLVGKDN